MTTMKAPERLSVDELTFEVRRSGRRKSLGLTIDRGGELILSAPTECDRELLEGFVREKRFWIYTKLAQKEALHRAQPVKELVSGEGYPYLGRSYRLLLVEQQEVPLKLEGGRFKLRRADVGEGRDHYIRWYTAHAEPWITERVERLKGRIGVEPGEVSIRKLGFRWGSCGAGGRLNFNWVTILLPATIVEYVVAHELVHLKEPHHSPEFWRRLERAMPDYGQRKEWLAHHGIEYVSLWEEPQDQKRG